ncbi:hypothetical protein AKJ09_07103 [Labilithrix luteola]|uniref:Type IV fimbrial biogenesis protein PilY1 n=1 Tax=Labilithrix luteola TaxID=1391654 RepID=A0A0K1Q4V9_9BACT|nr:hypothetical protein [Labilithrix luteola]AKV00440.1 hypothetical protein AKJ09_07103 [Labilithrix luteola]
MKRIFAFASASLALAAAAACATSQEEPQPQAADDAGSTAVPDTGIVSPTNDGGGTTPKDSGHTGPECSDAGWCTTALPDVDLTLRDIWPFETRAFAIAESLTLGVKVLEWNDADAKWAYVDDNTQNEYGFGQYAGKLWAPNENEVYYGVAPSLLYHGKRSAPGTPFTWERTRLPSNSLDTNPKHDPGVANYMDMNLAYPVTTTALGVWGAPGSSDVYAWYANTIFRLQTDGSGTSSWVPDYVLTDDAHPDDVFYVFGASGSSKDDVWFAVGRGRYGDTGAFACPMVIHKTPDGYARVLDNDINDADKQQYNADACHPKAGSLGFNLSISFPPYGVFTLPWTNGGYLTSIESAGPGAAVGIFHGKFFAYVSTNDPPTAAVNQVVVNVPRAFVPGLVNSVWVNGADTWVSGWGLVMHVPTDPARWGFGLGILTAHDADQNEADASTYTVSTTAVEGAPLDRPFYRVRGTSNTNIWAIGPRYALHKTTP